MFHHKLRALRYVLPQTAIPSVGLVGYVGVPHDGVTAEMPFVFLLFLFTVCQLPPSTMDSSGVKKGKMVVSSSISGASCGMVMVIVVVVFSCFSLG